MVGESLLRIAAWNYKFSVSSAVECLSFAGPDGELPEALQKLDPNILELVCNEILDRRSGIQWEDIAGQQDAKSLVQELVVWPMLNPHLFTVGLSACQSSTLSLPVTHLTSVLSYWGLCIVNKKVSRFTHTWR